MSIRQQLERSFEDQKIIYWSNLDRTSNILILLNFSLFFVSKLVITQGYYYTYYSLMFLAISKVGTLLPTGLLNRLWYYLMLLLFDLIATYYLVSSVWYWVVTSS